MVSPKHLINPFPEHLIKVDLLKDHSLCEKRGKPRVARFCKYKYRTAFKFEFQMKDEEFCSTSMSHCNNQDVLIFLKYPWRYSALRENAGELQIKQDALPRASLLQKGF